MSRRGRKKKNGANNPNRELILEINNLEEIKKQIEADLSFSEDIRLEGFKIRNLTIFKGVCNLVAPFVVIGLLTYIGGYFTTSTFPFVIDELVEKKVISLNYESDKTFEMTENYVLSSNASKLESNCLTIVTPWYFDGDRYYQVKRIYYVGTLSSFELFNAVINEDYDKVNELLSDYQEEITYANKIDIQSEDFYFEASLNMVDEDSKIYFPEDSITNIIVTLVELAIWGTAGALYTHFRNFDFITEVNHANFEYQAKVKGVADRRKELEEVEQKILTLKKKGGIPCE